MSDRREADDLDAVEAQLRGLRPRGASFDVDAILAAGLRPTINATGPLPRPRQFGLAVASWLGGVATGVAVTLLGLWLAADRRPPTVDGPAPRPLPIPATAVATRAERPTWRQPSDDTPESIGRPWLADALAAGVAQWAATDPAQRPPANERSPWRITLEELQR
ncbi:hypothetical protein LBMAG47_32240 [Planctomycetia bacterium]|jgi:hypothetical protein|nr:hypothetical protein LBMAG47_32240 [Planctomycetia bacterium]